MNTYVNIIVYISVIARFGVGVIVDFHNLWFIKENVHAKLEADDQNRRILKSIVFFKWL